MRVCLQCLDNCSCICNTVILCSTSLYEMCAHDYDIYSCRIESSLLTLYLFIYWGLGPLLHWHRLILPYKRRNNYIHYLVWNDITYSFPSFCVAAVRVWELIYDFIPYLIMHMLTYSCWWAWFHSEIWHIHLTRSYVLHGHGIYQSQSNCDTSI